MIKDEIEARVNKALSEAFKRKTPESPIEFIQGTDPLDSVLKAAAFIMQACTSVQIPARVVFTALLLNAAYGAISMKMLREQLLSLLGGFYDQALEDTKKEGS